MIRVNRGQCLPDFEQRAQQLISDFHQDCLQQPKLTVSKYWNNVRKKIREDAAHLSTFFHGKCCFCESRPDHVAWANIEHYRPKVTIDIAFDWNNWLLSCPKCNTTKSTKFPDCNGQPCLIDPTNEDPTQHIEFVGYIPSAITKRGRKTIEVVGLDRDALEPVRSKHLNYINALITLYYEIPAHHDEARANLVCAIQDESEYASMTRCYLRDRFPGLLQELQQIV